MSRDHDQQTQPETAGSEGSTNDPFVEGVPEPLFRQVVALRPGDVDGLVNLLMLFGSTYAPKILAIAAPRLGNAVVKQAIEITQSRQTQGRGGSMNQAEMHAILDDPSDAPTQGQPQGQGPTQPTSGTADDKQQTLDDLDSSDTVKMRPGIRAEVLALQPGDAQGLARLLALYAPVEGQIRALASRQFGNAMVAEALRLRRQTAEASATTEKPTEMSREDVDNQVEGGGLPDWVPGAQKYNQAHASLMAEFNEATNGSCADADGVADPVAVAAWQAAHGLPADGKIGPMTVAAARKAKAKAPEVAGGAQADARIPV